MEELLAKKDHDIDILRQQLLKAQEENFNLVKKLDG